MIKQVSTTPKPQKKSEYNYQVKGHTKNVNLN